MNQYPIVDVDKEEWDKKVNACLMYTIPSEDEALPILCQIQQILERLHQLPLHETLGEESVQYFFLNVFPVVCQKIIKSRYFKNQTVLKKANQILQNTVCLLPVYINLLDKIPQFIEVIQSVFTDEYYFKTNNQLDHKQQPYLYFPKSENLFEAYLEKGSKVDIIKFAANNEKYFWTHGTVLEINQKQLLVSYDLDYEYSSKKLLRNSYFVAPFKSKCTTFQWRKNLKSGDFVDVVDPFGGWYNATIIGVEEQEDGRKRIEVTIKVYNENGTKIDDKGRFFGFTDYKEKYDAFSAEVAPYCSVAKEFYYDCMKSQSDFVDDANDFECNDFEGKTIFALPRKKHLSQTLLKAINRFGSLGGFDKTLQKIQEKADLGMLSLYLKGLSGVAGYLHKRVIRNQVDRLKILLEKNILSQNANYTKQKSQMLSNGMRALLKRIYSSQISYEYENNLKIRVVQQNFEHETLKKRLHGLNELKEIIKTLTFGSNRNKKIIEWIKQKKIFEKIYLMNSHVQLIKKSQSFFRYIINENIFEVEDLQKLFKMAQKGDYQTRISLYSLFQEVSHVFKKHHVNFLIDKILESEPNLILNEDIDLLHELSKFSNYFPTKKVMQFFEKIILDEQIPHEINNYAIKKYSDMVAKNYQMKAYRKQVLKQFFSKLQTHDIKKISKILKHIFEGIGFGQWGKKDLSEMLQEQNFHQVIISCIKSSKEKENKSQIILQCMDILLSIYKLCSSFKILIETIQEIYKQISSQKVLTENYYKWCNQIFRCEQGVEVGDISQLIDLFEKLFDKKEQIQQEKNKEKIGQSVILQKLELLKSIFVEVNKRKKLLTVTNTMKEKQIQKQYRRKVSLKELVFYKNLLEFIFDQDDSVSEKSFEFLKTLYVSGQNSPEETEEFLRENLQVLTENANSETLSSTNKKVIQQTLRIIEFIIDDSEKDFCSKIDSMISKKKNYEIKLNFINSVSYMTEVVKKLEVTIPVNFTLYDLRNHLAKQLDIPWKSVKIELKNQIPYLLNCRTMKELGLTGLETLAVSRKAVPQQIEGEIIIGTEMNPKAERVFKIIFDQYSTDGKMSKAQCNQFTVKCLGPSSSPRSYEDKINNLYKQYDEDQDDYLEFKEFLKFYKNAAILKSSTVWTNLRSFGVHGNFKFSHQINEEVNIEKLPRHIMSKMPQIYHLLFRLLKCKEVAPAAFYLLERLPISKDIESQILSSNKEEFEFQTIFDTKDLYVFFYKLNVIEYLVFPNNSKTQEQNDWIFRFLANEGFEKLIEKLFFFIESYKKVEQNSKVLLEIIDSMLDMITNFMMKCYSTKSILKCQMLFVLDLDLSEKIEYLVTGSFSKPEITFPDFDEEINQEYILKLSKTKILQQILHLFEALWTSNQTNESNYSKQNTVYLEQILISKIMLLLPVLIINQDITHFTSKMDIFINNCNNQKTLKKLYELIACIAFFNDEGNGQKIIINEMFKHLTKTSIISEHFSVLAVLVSKYGVQAVNQEEIVQVLIKNIFNSNNQLTIEGCSRLLHNFNLESINEKYFDDFWENCLFGEQKRAKKNSTRDALYELILKASQNKKSMNNYIISKIKEQILQCIQKMRITSCIEDNQRSLTGYAGLKNLGNICYINSMMQQLFMNKNFRYLILRIKDYQPQNLAEYKEKLYDDNILHQIQRIFAYLQLTSRADYVAAGFCLAYKPFGESVNVMIQQDVQQFVSMFFDQLQNKIKSTPLKKVLETFYGGKSTNLFNCHDCNQTKKVEENFYSITLEVKNSKTLNDSFNRYVSGQLISDFRCDFCNKKVDVSKKTRISQPPKTLIIHLQRIVFNLDTFINEKISTRHEFPMSLDLYPYSLAEYEKSKEITTEQEKKIRDSMQYQLVGIICHIGNAQSGHYLSYIKIQENKWIEFNDSMVNNFNESSIETECFGGVVNSFMDDFEYDKSSQSSKSAYILLYERQGETKIQAVLRSLEEKGVFLKQYELSQVIEKLSQNEKEAISEDQMKEEESQSQSESVNNDKLQEQILKLEVEQKIRRKSQDINLDLEKIQQIQKELNKNPEIIIQIDSNITPYIPQELKKEILHDNQIHFFQKNLASPAFIKFFANLLKHPHDHHNTIIKMLKQLSFGFWAKSPNFRDLLKTCQHFIEFDFKFSDEIIFSNPQIVTYLIENPDSQVRTNVAGFLASTFSTIIEKNGLRLTGQSQIDKKIVKFLDQLFSLLPTTVSKAWTKFGQYFEFWYQFGTRGNVQLEYMIRNQILKHFLDYYMDKKSPLKIYEKKPQIGSIYANPNFTMLLKTTALLISSILNSSQHKLSEDDYKILINFECMEKLISENYQNLAVSLIKQICRNNLYASEKIAIIILKGLHRSTFNNVQPYLDVLHAYALIDDQYQLLRAKWVLGKPALYISTVGKNIHALSSFAFEERVYTYHSSISLQQASSLLDPIYQLNKRAQNFAMMSLKQALKLCMQSDFLFNYIWTLPPPSLCYGNIYDFYIQFIERYTQQAKRSYNSSQMGFNKEDLGNEVKKMYDQLMMRWIQKNCESKNSEITSSQNVLTEVSSCTTSAQSVPTSSEIKEKDTVQKIQTESTKKYYPVAFNFIQKQKQQIEGLQITRHESQLTFALLQPTGKSNNSFHSGVMQKNIEKIKDEVWSSAKVEIVSGYYVFNKSRNLIRIKTDDGTQLIKPNDYMWVWASKIEKVWQCERMGDWPKWELYSMAQ